MDIKQEDLIKFWTWCGCFHHRSIDLNLIYKYAIPKLNSKNMVVTLIIFDGCRCLIHVLENGYIYSWDAPTPTEALYNAIMKVIDNEKEK